MKKVFVLILILILLISAFLLSSCENNETYGLSVVTTNFPAYDFARNILGDKGNVFLILPPGGESHTYEPTAKDIIRISECDIFIYNGGESDSWVETLLSSLETPPYSIKMMDYIDICDDEHTDITHHDHIHETDEHIWTSLKNSIKIISGLCFSISTIDKENIEHYYTNANAYSDKISKLDWEFEELFKNSKHNTIVVADRFPFTHFANDYGLNYYSAYHSCSEDAEPTPKIIAELIDAVERENIPIIFHLEFSNKMVATAISEDTGAIVKLLHSCHNVTKKQLDAGVTYIDLMRNNYEILKEAVTR